ncbi:MAG: hypothetical protein ABL921_13990, partial [Pirellula sp.]
QGYQAPASSGQAPPVQSPGMDTEPSYAKMRSNVLNGSPYDGKTAEQIKNEILESSGVAPRSSSSPGSAASSSVTGSGGGRSTIDNLQVALDAIGVFDPTPFSDLSNAMMSFVRAVANPSQMPRHLMNAGISMLGGGFPGIGDVAKLGKSYGSGGNPASNLLNGISSDFIKKRFGPNAGQLFDSLMNSPFPFAGRAASGGATGAFGRLVAGVGARAAGTGAAVAAGAGGAGGGAVAGGLAVAAGASGPVGLYVASLIMGVVAMKKLHDVINEIAKKGREVIEHNRYLADYSGQFSQSLMQYDVNRARLDMDKANYMAPALSGLTQNQIKLENSAQELFKPWDRTKNNAMSGLVGLTTMAADVLIALEPLRKIQELLYQQADANKVDDKDARNPFEHSLNQMDVERRMKPRLPADGGKKE